MKLGQGQKTLQDEHVHLKNINTPNQVYLLLKISDNMTNPQKN